MYRAAQYRQIKQAGKRNGDLGSYQVTKSKVIEFVEKSKYEIFPRV